jgi:hypothetical protein
LVYILINFSVKLERILQLLPSIVVDGAQAAADKSVAQKHDQGKDPQIPIRITPEYVIQQAPSNLYIRY